MTRKSVAVEIDGFMIDPIPELVEVTENLARSLTRQLLGHQLKTTMRQGFEPLISGQGFFEVSCSKSLERTDCL